MQMLPSDNTTETSDKDKPCLHTKNYLTHFFQTEMKEVKKKNHTNWRPMNWTRVCTQWRRKCLCLCFVPSPSGKHTGLFVTLLALWSVRTYIHKSRPFFFIFLFFFCVGAKWIERVYSHQMFSVDFKEQRNRGFEFAFRSLRNEIYIEICIIYLCVSKSNNMPYINVFICNTNEEYTNSVFFRCQLVCAQVFAQI